MHKAIMWNPWNKVVQDHRDGTIYHELTNETRRSVDLPVPWTPEIATVEQYQPAIYLPDDARRAS